MTTHARSHQPETQPDPPFAPVVEVNEEDTIWDTRTSLASTEGESLEEIEPPLAAEPDDWTDCPSCGTTHFKNAKYCRKCGTHLSSGVRHTHDSASSSNALRCRTCGGNDIEREH
jgi:ribosomal protein L40E